MSIRVTKEGKLPEEQPYTGKCLRCGCEVEVDLKDLGRGYSCTCPTQGCGNKITCYAKEKQRYVDTDKVKYTERTEQ